MQAATDKRASYADWLLVATPGVIWGASFLFIAEGLRAIAPNGVSFIRIAIGFATLSFFPAARKRIDKSAWPGIFALGVLWFAFPLSMFPFAEQRVSSALTGMLNGATALSAAAVATVPPRRLPSRAMLTGLGVGFTGAVLVAWPGVAGSTQADNQALGIVLIALALTSY